MKPPFEPATPRPSRARLLDASLSEILRAPPRILDHDAIDALTRVFPLPGIAAAAPLYPEGAYAWDRLLKAAQNAIMLEPLTEDAHRHAHRHLQELPQGDAPLSLPLPGRPGQARRVLVDPESVPLAEADADPDDSGELPAGWVRERVVTLSAPAPTEDGPGSLPARTGDENVLPRIALLIARMPRTQRLRLRDPYGAITPELARRLSGLVDSPRLTLHLENPDGLGPATARAALTPARGPLVRTTLLGVGPRTGLPPTELFYPPTHPQADAVALNNAVQALKRHAGIVIGANHPYWGSARHAAAESEHLDDPHAEPRTNPATIAAILDDHLKQWELNLTPEQRDRVLARLIATMRPGENITGPVLWAVVAQETDLKTHAHSRESHEPAP